MDDRSLRVRDARLWLVALPFVMAVFLMPYVVCGAAEAAAEPAPAANFVFILADDQSWSGTSVPMIPGKDFSLAADLGESRNLVREKPDVAVQMRAELLAHVRAGLGAEAVAALERGEGRNGAPPPAAKKKPARKTAR